MWSFFMPVFFVYLLLLDVVSFQGLVVMSEEFEAVFTSFINNKVPGMWHRKGYNSLKSLGSWIYDLTLRIDFVEVSIWDNKLLRYIGCKLYYHKSQKNVTIFNYDDVALKQLDILK